MSYSKPEITTIASAANVIQSSQTKTGVYQDSRR